MTDTDSSNVCGKKNTRVLTHALSGRPSSIIFIPDKYRTVRLNTGLLATLGHCDLLNGLSLLMLLTVS